MELSDFFEMYNPLLFQDGIGGFGLSESQRDAKVKGAKIKLDDATFKFGGENIWKSSQDMYNKDSEKHDFKFRRTCDGFAFCQYNDRRFLIWIELKSGFNDVFNKAIYQISACYTKMQSYLRALSSYKSGEFEELAIVVSRPEEEIAQSLGDNDMIQSRRLLLTSTTETAEVKCRRRYRATGEITIDANDFYNESISVSNDILPHSLKCFHVATTEAKPTIDLAAILHI